jgi:hypothetical protein
MLYKTICDTHAGEQFAKPVVNFHMCIPESGLNIDRARRLKVLEYGVLTSGAKPTTDRQIDVRGDKASQSQFMDSLGKVMRDIGKRRLLLGKAL